MCSLEKVLRSTCQFLFYICRFVLFTNAYTNKLYLLPFLAKNVERTPIVL